MNFFHNKTLLTTVCTALLSQHTVTAYNLKDLKFWDRGKTENFSIKEELPENSKLIVANQHGDISVKTWKQPKIVVEAKKHGSDKALQATSIKHHLQGNTFKIETAYNDPKTKCTVSYDILVPEDMHLQSVTTQKGTIAIENSKNGLMAKTEKGSIHLDNVQGIIKTSATRGPITINAGKLAPESKILAISGRGTITLSVPEDTKAQLYLKTNKGMITSELPVTLKERTTKLNANAYAQAKRETQGTIGEGGDSAIKLHTSSGHIKLLCS